MFLSVDEYNTNEKEGKKALSNRFLEAFQPELFEKAGFPTRISENGEVYKFVDSMHDGRWKKYYGRYLWEYAPTYGEFEMLKAVVKDIHQFTKERYHRGILVKAPLLASMNMLRRINCLGGGIGELPKIFEIGGGSGILGILLHRAGYQYIATDITQAFYLTQNHLWEGLEPDCVVECIDSLEHLNSIDGHKMIHIPYWKLWELRNNDLEADIIVANHNLCEMHERSLLFYLQYAKQLMRNSEYKLLVTQGPGSVRLRNVDYLLHTFRQMGFELLYSERLFAVFALKDKKQTVPVHMGDLMRKESYQNAFPVCGNPLDQTAAMLYAAERDIRDEEKVSLQEIEEYFHTLDEHMDSPDEEFIHYCGYEEI